jgi:hypothetical protein
MAGKKKKTISPIPPGSPTPQEIKMAKKRLKIKAAFQTGEIKDFADIFDVYMDETPFAALIEMQNSQLTVKLKNLEKFNFQDVKRISTAFDVDFDIVMNFIGGLVKAQYGLTTGKTKST